MAGASHYCESFEPRPGIAEQSLEDFMRLQLSKRRLIAEGTELFNEYRACALRDAERSLFLAASHYRRGLDLMIPSSSHWAHVTLYYGAWFAARALLGIFGCVVLGKHVIHVNRSSPSDQELRIQRIGAGQDRYNVNHNGLHQRFWEIFYRAVPSIRPFVDDKFKPTLSPISSSDVWLIEQRNRVNYNTIESIGSISSFSLKFSEGDFPGCLQGVLNTQYKVCEGILAASCSFATKLGLATDALDVLSDSATLGQKVQDLVYGPVVPDLVAKTKKTELFGN